MPDRPTRLAERRRATGLTQKQLAKRSGVPLGTLRRWEQTGRPPRRLAYVVNCAIALGCEDRLALVEESWLAWTPMPGRAEPPAPPPVATESVRPRHRPRRDTRESEVPDDMAEAFERDFLGGL